MSVFSELPRFSILYIVDVGDRSFTFTGRTMESDDEAKLVWLRETIDIGIADIDRGDVIDGEQAVAEARWEYWRRIQSALQPQAKQDVDRTPDL